MRLIAAIILTLIATLPAYAAEKQCSDCPPDKPCEVSEKVDCNSCTHDVYCIDGVWKRSSLERCTLMYCGDTVISNPFAAQSTDIQEVLK